MTEPVNLGMVPPEQMTAAQQAAARAVTEAQTPEQYAAAAAAAGLTGDAESAALAGAHPVAAPDFSELLAQARRDQQAQIDKLSADFEAQINALRAGIPAPAVDPRVPVAQNLNDGVALLARSYPLAGRVDPLAVSAAQLAAALTPVEEGAPVPIPDAGLVEDLIRKFRRFAAANPALETGIFEHAAQIAEDVFEL